MSRRVSKQSRFRRQLIRRIGGIDHEPRAKYFGWCPNERQKKKRPKLTLDERIQRELERKR
jgi:hypothetical protein